MRIYRLAWRRRLGLATTARMPSSRRRVGQLPRPTRRNTPVIRNVRPAIPLSGPVSTRTRTSRAWPPARPLRSSRPARVPWPSQGPHRGRRRPEHHRQCVHHYEAEGDCSGLSQMPCFGLQPGQYQALETWRGFPSKSRIRCDGTAVGSSTATTRSSPTSVTCRTIALKPDTPACLGHSNSRNEA